MKHFLILLAIIATITPAYSLNYYEEATKALEQCQKDGKKNCPALQKYTNRGIAYYSSIGSFKYRNEYCRLLNLRLEYKFSGTKAQLDKDAHDYNLYCN